MVDPVPLRVAHLSERYRLPGGGAVETVSDVSFAVRAGECFGILGPNGAGKTTVIICLSGLYPVTAGEARLGGIDAHADYAAAARVPVRAAVRRQVQ
jgi:ABC-type multidrug transport system ATPase subunit